MISINYFKLAASFSALLMALNPGTAFADLTLTVQAYQPHQVQLTGAVKVGTVVAAATNLNNIWASVDWRVECSEGNVRPPIYGSAAGADNGFVGPKQITITSPAVYPTTYALPGWSAIAPGTSFDCVNYYSGAAKTSRLPIGAGGAVFQIGGEEYASSNSLIFDVVKPGNALSSGCTP